MESVVPITIVPPGVGQLVATAAALVVVAAASPAVVVVAEGASVSVVAPAVVVVASELSLSLLQAAATSESANSTNKILFVTLIASLKALCGYLVTPAWRSPWARHQPH